MVKTEEIKAKTKSNCYVVNITEEVAEAVSKSGIRDGVVTIFNVGSMALKYHGRFTVNLPQWEIRGICGQKQNLFMQNKLHSTPKFTRRRQKRRQAKPIFYDDGRKKNNDYSKYSRRILLTSLRQRIESNWYYFLYDRPKEYSNKGLHFASAVFVGNCEMERGQAKESLPVGL